MKTLLLLRHAKSSWKDPQLEDHQRPLNSRGRKAAKLIGHQLKCESIAVGLVLCSTSLRTRETAALVFHEQKELSSISYRDDLYHPTPDQITAILQQIDEPTECVMLIGHNPGFEQFLASLTGSEVHFPTAALAHLDLEIQSWKSFNHQTQGQLVQIWRPKEIDQK